MENAQAFEFKTEGRDLEYLNLFAGVGGNRKLLPENVKVTAVEYNEEIAEVYQSLYKNDTVIVGDAFDYLKKNFERFDIVAGSPPCPSHSKMMKFTRHKVADYPDMRLYGMIIFLDNFFKGKWVIENVKPYYEPLIKPTVEIGRHLFWSNFPISKIQGPDQPKGFINKSTLEGKRQMMDWLGIHFDKTIYYGNNHCPVQILRNCVHPEIGLHVFNCAVGVLNSNAQLQTSLWNTEL